MYFLPVWDSDTSVSFYDWPLFHGLITVIFCSNSYIYSFVPFLINCDPLQTGNDSFTVPANPALFFYFFAWDSKFLMVNTALDSILH